MNDKVISHFFGAAHAPAYDQRWSRLAPMADSLHFLTGAVLAELPAEARILCVGAGTGAELISLAKTFPAWRFTAVEPSAAMLDVCRRKVEALGLNSRCDFHEGFLETLPSGEPFDGASAILVSHFLTDAEERRAFFRGIARRLKPGGLLVNAEIASSSPLALSGPMIKAWNSAHGAAAPTTSPPPGWGTDVAVGSPREIEALVASAGFEAPTLFHQALFIHAWFARRTPTAAEDRRPRRPSSR